MGVNYIFTNGGKSLDSVSIKIVIPMAGYGARLRPHTWSRPKQLIRMADKLVIDHVLDTFTSLPAGFQAEYIFIIGYLGNKIKDYLSLNYPNLNARFVEQPEMRGQSHAIFLAKNYLDGPMLVLYGDTLIKNDFSFLSSETAGAVAFVKAVPDPRRFGVAGLGPDGWVTNLVEKPQNVENNLVLVGCYYFQKSSELLSAIEEQMQRNITLKDEFFLADAVNIMLEHGLKMRVEHVDTWLDAGIPDDVLKTNRYLLENGHANTADTHMLKDVVVVPPVFIHPSASVESSVIGPHTTVGAGCKVQGCIIRDSIIDDGSDVGDVILEHSLVGREVKIRGHAGALNVGDRTELSL
jgi:glucose-1-phosphate thymidylyltransferase